MTSDSSYSFSDKAPRKRKVKRTDVNPVDVGRVLWERHPTLSVLYVTLACRHQGLNLEDLKAATPYELHDLHYVGERLYSETSADLLTETVINEWYISEGRRPPSKGG